MSSVKKANHLEALIDNENRQNDLLDRKIQNLNLNIQERKLSKDIMFNEKELTRRNER